MGGENGRADAFEVGGLYPVDLRVYGIASVLFRQADLGDDLVFDPGSSRGWLADRPLSHSRYGTPGIEALSTRAGGLHRGVDSAHLSRTPGHPPHVHGQMDHRNSLPVYRGVVRGWVGSTTTGRSTTRFHSRTAIIPFEVLLRGSNRRLPRLRSRRGVRGRSSGSLRPCWSRAGFGRRLRRAPGRLLPIA